MMISRRPVSSPGRVEKYPPPLMGFLRSKSNGGGSRRSRSRSRSKGRSRASPLFLRRNNNNNKSATATATVTQEPSSPKVTCMGQVRVKRSKPRVQQPENPTRKKKRCEWIRRKIKTVSSWPKWGFFSFSCSRRKSKELDSPRSKLDCPVTELVGEIREGNVEEEEEEEGEDFKIPKLFVSPASTPPQPPINAFLLTRSRSAPYSSSSLAFKFWEENNQREAEESRNVRSENLESEKINEINESEAKIDGEEVELTEVAFERRPELTRSKSEPARIGEKRSVLLPDEEEG